jgi:ribosomal protein S28E/S33
MSFACRGAVCTVKIGIVAGRDLERSMQAARIELIA